MVEKFEFDSKLKKNLYIMMGVGVLGLVWAFFSNGLHDNHSRFWSNILLNAYFFTGIGIFGIFFASANQLGYSGWITLVKRIYMSLSGFIVIGAVFAAILIGGVWLHYHNLYDHWALPEEAAKLANTKQTFFNRGFWTGRIVLYFALWIFVGKAVVNAINAKNIGDEKVYKKSKLMAALWIVVFAVTESFVSWDMVMSTDPHWYSTLFGWYNFASYGCAGFAFAIILVIYLKSKGLMQQVNENHIHDMGKFMFGFSIFWTYLWFSQFMLQWYGNIPEDTKYWIKRFDVPTFKFTIFLALTINFLAPLLLFLKRDAKRSMKMAVFISVLVIFGHYVDFFNMTMYEPNALNAHHSAHAIAEAKACCTEGAAECCKKDGAVAATAGTTALYAENKVVDKMSKEEKPATDAKAENPGEKSANEAAAQTSDEAKESKEEKAEEGGEAHHGESHEGEASAGDGAAAAHHGAETSHHGDAPAGHHGDAEDAPKTKACLGFPELLIFTGFLGMFLFMFFREFSKDTTFNENDPYLKESLRHHVEYA